MCPDEELLERYLADDAGDSRAEIESHFGECERCRRWLSAARADDALLRDVRRAWARSPSAGSSAPQPPDAGAPPAPTGAAPQIAGFRMLHRLGEGGMGVVFAAEQLQPRRPVAIKVLRGGALADPQRVRLFQREAHALARLSHPAIVPIYAAAVMPDGSPYLVMEQIDGLPLGEHVRAHAPPLRDRLELFLQITAAITYAHQRGVIHRDLKPSNILVGRSGLPTDAASRDSGAGRWSARILDFGLARIMECEHEFATMTADVGRIRGTLAYMSPEQARGRSDDIDTRSDVYSLGVILYELLTGELPCDVRRGDLAQAIRTVCDEPPQRPSARRRELRGDLDTIILKALEKDPARRYGSVAALEDDIRRHLSSRPIQARPPSWSYALRKFVARHTVGCGFGATVAILLVALAVSNAVHARRLARERDETARQRDRAMQIGDYLRGTLAWFDPAKAKGSEVTLRDVLDAAADRLERELRGQPEARASIHLTLGHGYQGIGLYEKSETHIRSALELRRAVYGEEHVAVAECLDSLARLLQDREQWDAAEPIYREALDMRIRLLGEEHADVAETLANLAAMLTKINRADEAEPLMRRAMEIHRRVVGHDDIDTAIGLNNLGMMAFHRGAYDEAEKLMRDGLDVRRRINAYDDPETATAIGNLASIVLHARNDVDEAERLMREEAAMRRRLLGDDHPMVALAWENLATFMIARNRPADAIDMLREALKIHQRNPAVAGGAAADAKRLVGLLESQGRRAEADALRPLLKPPATRPAVQNRQRHEGT